MFYMALNKNTRRYIKAACMSAVFMLGFKAGFKACKSRIKSMLD
jgi:hypothetical protein